MKLKSGFLAALWLLTAESCALAGSTVDPSQPSTRGAFTSAPVRNNFLAAYNDINNILGVFAAPAAPNSPTHLQSWADTTASPVVVFKYWNQVHAVWIPYAILNTSSNSYTPFFTPGGYVANAPITISVSGGVATFGLAKDSNFATVSGALAFAPIADGSLLARCAGSAGEPSACTWAAFAARAIGNTNGIFPHYVGGTWTTDTTGTSGHAVPFLDGSNIWGAPQTIYLGSSSLRAAISGTVLRGAQADGTPAVSQLDSFGAATAYTCVRSNGTAAVSTALTTNDLICALGGHGFDGTANSSVAAAFRLYASQPWTGSAHGTFARIAVTANGSTSPVDQFGIEQDGGLTLPPTVTGGSKGAGTINISGNYYVGGNQINFSNLAGQAALSQLPTIGANTVLGSVAGGTPIALTQAQQTAMINLATASLSGALPPWPGNTTTYFRGDGTYPTLNFAAISGVATGAQLPVPGASSLGGVNSKDCSPSGQFVQKINTDGSITCVTPAGGGNLSTSGTPSANQTGVFGSSTTLQGVGPGIAGQQFTSNGPSSPPSFQSGGWVLLNTLTASNSASLSDTTSLTANYNEYQIVFDKLVPATNAVQCQMTVRSGGTFQTTNYSAPGVGFASTSVVGNTATTFIPCSNANSADIGNSASGGLSGAFRVQTPSGTSTYKGWNGQFSFLNQSGGFTGAINTGAWIGGTGAVDGFLIKMNSGNISSGTVKIYGRL